MRETATPEAEPVEHKSFRRQQVDILNCQHDRKYSAEYAKTIPGVLSSQVYGVQELSVQHTGAGRDYQYV